MARNNNRILVQNARQALNQLKFEVASQIGVDYNANGGYLGNLPTREAGRIGGNMVKSMIAAAEQSLINQAVSNVRASFAQTLQSPSQPMNTTFTQE